MKVLRITRNDSSLSIIFWDIKHKSSHHVDFKNKKIPGDESSSDGSQLPISNEGDDGKQISRQADNNDGNGNNCRKSQHWSRPPMGFQISVDKTKQL